MKRRTKRIVTRVVIILILLSTMFLLKGQAHSNDVHGELYQEYGEWVLIDGANKVSIEAFSTVEKTWERQSKSAFAEKKTLESKFHYDLYLTSKSIYLGDTTSTWIYGARIYIDGKEVTADQFPNGFTASIATKPTLIYWYVTNDSSPINLYIKWDNATYENRVHIQNNQSNY